MKRIIGVYKIVNKINGNWYVGSSRNIVGRWKRHKKGLNDNKHPNKHLLSAWNKYGEQSFIFEIIKEVQTDTEAVELEQHIIDEYFDTGVLYNKSKIAKLSTAQAIEKNKNKHTGTHKKHIYTKEQIGKMRQSTINRWKSTTPEQLKAFKEKAKIYGAIGGKKSQELYNNGKYNIKKGIDGRFIK
jgi:group I intron endonuclease